MINRNKTSEFHFVCNNKFKTKILGISKILNFSLSKTVIFIIESMSALSLKIHLLYNDEKNKSEKVDWNCHIHVFFNNEKKVIYHMLKSIHKDNNTYSMAGKLRYLIKVFLKGVDLFGFEKFLEILKSAKIKWEGRKINKRIWVKNARVRQLNIIPCLITKYASDYTPIYIKYLN